MFLLGHWFYGIRGSQQKIFEPESEERLVQYVCFPKEHEKNTEANQRKREKYFAKKE